MLRGCARLSLLWLLWLLPSPPAALADGVDTVVIAHPAVPVTTISRGDLARIYLRGGVRWPDGRLAVPIDVAGESAHKVAFYRTRLNRSLYDVRTERARLVFTGVGTPPETLPSFDEVIRRVASVAGAVGYVPAALVDGSVQVLRVAP